VTVWAISAFEMAAKEANIQIMTADIRQKVRGYKKNHSEIGQTVPSHHKKDKDILIRQTDELFYPEIRIRNKT